MAGGRPRDPQVDGRVLSATVELLGEVGVRGLRTDAVAARAGVPKSTIYRRWPSVQHLVLDAMTAAVGHQRFEATDDPAADLRRLATAVAAIIAGPQGALLVQIGAQIMHDPELSADYRARLVDPNRDFAVSLVRRGQQTGVFAAEADPELVIDQTIGGVVYRVLFLHQPVEADAVDRIVDDLMRRLTPTGSPPRPGLGG